MAEKFELFCGCFGNGTTVCNKAVTESSSEGNRQIECTAYVKQNTTNCKLITTS